MGLHAPLAEECKGECGKEGEQDGEDEDTDAHAAAALPPQPPPPRTLRIPLGRDGTWSP